MGHLSVRHNAAGPTASNATECRRWPRRGRGVMGALPCQAQFSQRPRNRGKNLRQIVDVLGVVVIARAG